MQRGLTRAGEFLSVAVGVVMSYDRKLWMKA